MGRGTDERWHLKKDGSRFWADGEMMPLQNDHGEIKGFTKVLRNQTNRKLAEEKAQADSAFLKSVLASSGDCIKVLDLDGNLVFMTQGGQVLMEVSDFNAIKGCPWPSFWGGEGQEAALAAVNKARAGEVGHFRGPANTFAGTRKWWDVQVTPIYDATGNVAQLLSVSRDISETREAERAVRDSEVQWHDLFENLHEGFILGELVRDQEGKVADWRYLDVNSAWGEMVNIAPEQARGRTIRETFPSIEDAWIDEMASVVETRQQTVFLRKVGALGRWYEGRTLALQGDRFAVMFLDVTRRQRADSQRQALVDLSDKLQNTDDVVEISRFGAEIIGCTLGANRAGYATVEADGASICVANDWTAPKTQSIAGLHQGEQYGAYFFDLAKGEIVEIGDVEKDERTYKTSAALVQLSVRALINLPLMEHGRLVAVLFVSSASPRYWEKDEIDFVRDVGERTRSAIERVKAERALQALAHSLAQQVEKQTRERNRLWLLSDDPFLVAETDGRWARVNPAWTRLLGWSENELVGQTAEWILHPDDAKTPFPGGSVATAPVAAQHAENRLRAKDGSYRWLSWTAVYEDGFYYCVVRDVTAERELLREKEVLEDALRQSQKMEAVGQLTGGLAHDFNNLLTGITGSLELLSTRVSQGRLGELDRYIGAAQGAAKRAAILTHRLLAFSRRQTLDPKPVDANRLIAEMEELLRRAAGPAVHIEVVGSAGAWPILADANQLENALLNLCINARDAMPKGGRITIETTNKWLDAWTGKERDLVPGQYLALCVTDTGMGMSPDVIARAFDPFFTTKPIGVGTGLGLSMVYGFVRQSGGQVRIYSEPGQGTMMTLYFPRHHGEIEVPDTEHTLSNLTPAERGLTVLVVDDEPTIRMLVTEVLSEFGYLTVEAADGASGLKVIESNLRIDLMVSDVGLPGGMNGRQLADAARLRRPDLPVLFITGYAENAAVGNGYLEPGMHVLTKPFTMETLTHRVKDLLSDQVGTRAHILSSRVKTS
jgi:PAS domain S-box-containing protein